MALQGQVRDPQPQLCDPEDAASAGAAYSIIGLQAGAPGCSLPRGRGCVLGEHAGGQLRRPWGRSHILLQKPASAKRKGFWLLVFSSQCLGKRKENLALRLGPRMVVPVPSPVCPLRGGGLPSLVSCQGWRALVQGPGGPGGRVGETVHPCMVSGNCTPHPASPAVLPCYRR